MLEPRRLCFILLGFLASFSHAAFINTQIGNDLSEYAEVKSILNEIRTVSLIKRGQFFDYDPNVTKTQILQANFNEGTEATINRNYIDDLFENDILLTVEQAREILQEVKDAPREAHKKRRPRQAQPGERYFWKTPEIPFKFYWNDADWQNLIHMAHRHIESETCIRFIENGTGPDYLLYTRGSGCWSNVGRVGGRQQISIGYGCDAMGIVAHETFHALALWHEQSRTDRDSFIEIEWKNIFRGTESNFEKRTPKNSENYEQPYDLGSVMHYGSKAFSSDWESYSILTKDPNYQMTIGQRAAISFKDAKMINIRYCSKICSQELDCKNGGYTDPNDCERCKCPDGYGGTLCDSVPASNASCKAGEFVAASMLRHINSPPLEAGQRCYWRIKAPSGQRILLNVTNISFECNNACSSYLEIKYRRQKVSTGARFCCDAPQKPILSEDEEVLVIYVGASEIVKGWLGFQLTYQTVDSNGPDPPTTSETDQPTTGTTSTSKSTTTSKTTPEPTTSPTSQIPGKWSEWGGWSGCTVSCGGCGTRKRVRACYGGNRKCDGLSYDFGNCGQEPCIYSYKTTRCDGRLILPCDLLEKLDFGTTRLPTSLKIQDPPKSRARTVRSLFTLDASSNQIEPTNPFHEEHPFLRMTPKNAQLLREVHRENAVRSKRFVDGNRQLEMKIYCEKKFTYNCPTNLLTVSMDWKSAKEGTIMQSDTRLCCEGYVSRGGKCLKP